MRPKLPHCHPPCHPHPHLHTPTPPHFPPRAPEPLHYVGTSFGLTQDLYGFWRKNDYLPVYLRQTPSDVTGEHTVIMLRPLQADEASGMGIL